MSWLQAIPYPHLSPIFFEIGPLQFRWYGLMYLIGLTAAYFLITRKVREKRLAITKDQIYDMVVWAALGVFIGGRIGYTLFYNFSYYAQHPLKIFAVWEGGMSFHGGLIGTIVSLIWFSKRQGIPVYTIAWKFHQWRALRTPRRCSLVYGVSHRRTGLPPPVAAL
jgi:phosphatidylglycerol:prolipoprotein diacylglycerol transferase